MADHAVTRGPAWMVQAAEIAKLFYVDGLSKTDIARAVGLSRFKVARIIQESLERGLVEVRIHSPTSVETELSTALAKAYGLRRAIVVTGPSRVEAGGPVHEHLCRLAAELLEELVTDEDVLGLSCSRNVTATVDMLSTLASSEVLQLTGTLNETVGAPGSVESVRRAAAVGGGPVLPIYAPMLLPDAAVARSLAADPEIRSTLDRIPDVTIALVSVGAWLEDGSSVWRSVDEKDRCAGSAAGAVGEIGARLFDAHGRPVRTEMDERVLGMTLEQLRAVPEVVALGLGAQRVEAVRAALVGKLVTTLVCESDLAHALLEAARTETP